MRRVTGLILAALGIILIAAAVLLPTYVSAQIVKFPLNETTTATLAGTGVSYFSQTKLVPETGASVRATYTIKGDAAAGSSSTARVDPQTGALLNVNEDEQVTLRNPTTGGTVAVLFDGDLVATPATVTEVVSLDSSGRTELAWLDTFGPLTAGIAGALIAGIVLLVRKPRQNENAQRSSSRAASSR
jgi:hypothetical protein